MKSTGDLFFLLDSGYPQPATGPISGGKVSQWIVPTVQSIAQDFVECCSYLKFHNLYVKHASISLFELNWSFNL